MGCSPETALEDAFSEIEQVDQLLSGSRGSGWSEGLNAGMQTAGAAVGRKAE